jgi:DNA replication protein DnaC
VPSCEICDDTTWKSITVDGVTRVTRCDCVHARAVEQQLKDARIPPRYQRCSLDTFTTYDNERLLSALRVARRFVEDFPHAQKGLMLIGPPGIGKTHIAVAVLREAITRTGLKGRYSDTRTLLREIRETYNPVTRTAEMDVIRPVMEADLLVLDDLGAERLTDWVEETMSLIVNTRYNERRLTIFTSNHEDIPETDDADMNSLIVKVGFRLHSRLREMCEFLEYDGPDYRNMPPNSGADDLYKLWKAQPRRKLPVRSSGQVRAQLREKKAIPRRGDESVVGLNWSGGKAGNR